MEKEQQSALPFLQEDSAHQPNTAARFQISENLVHPATIRFLQVYVSPYAAAFRGFATWPSRNPLRKRRRTTFR